MMPLWKKATSPTIEEAARDIMIKRSLTKHLAKCVHDLQQQLINADDVVIGGENVSNVCFCLEAIFIHGLKDTLAKKMSSVFNSGNEKIPDFWPVAMVYSHKNVLAHINNLSQITTDVGRCRAWLRLALNDSLLVSYVEAMIQDGKTLPCYYRSTAYMSDREQPGILKQFLEGLAGFSFQVPVNCAILNCWNPTPLQLAGLWKFADSAEPVMPAFDVTEFFQHEAGQSRRLRSKLSVTAARKVTASMAIQADGPAAESQHSAASGRGGGGVGVAEAPSAIATAGNEAAQTNPDAPLEQPGEGSKEEGAQTTVSTSVGSSIGSAQVRELLHALQLDANEGSAQQSDHTGSPASVPDLDAMERFPGEPRRSFGNVLDPSQGWSSPFDEDYEDVDPPAGGERSDGGSEGSLDPQSYDSLVLSYTQNINQKLSGTPEMRDLISSAIRGSGSQAAQEDAGAETEERSSTTDSLDDLADFEVVPSSRAPDPRTAHLLSLLGNIQQEKGLDQQCYECRGCSAPIGMIYGPSHVCTYDGYSYCPDCMREDSHVIPARMVHNWDFRKHPVSVEAKALLKKYESEPLLDLRALNPSLYAAVPELATVQVLRSQLGFLRPYLQTCSESASSALRKLIWPREHLYEHVHLYSAFDLLQVPSGALQRTLEKAIKFARAHVLACQLCAAKGFVCEICQDPAIIYAFDTAVTYHCGSCFAVYHRTCIESSRSCPKCERRRQRQEALTDDEAAVSPATNTDTVVS
ncbi:pleckstrin homology domain-containing family M member 1 [Ixodes scapularis]